MLVIIALVISVLSLYFIIKIKNESIKWLLSFVCCILPIVCSFILTISKQESFDYSTIFNLIFVYFIVKIVHNLLYIFVIYRKGGILSWIVGWSGIVFYIFGMTLTMKTHASEEPYFMWIVIFTGIFWLIEFISTFYKKKEVISS